ncbi:MAG: DUF547 domain-containing protein [Planctomycetota bacterium]|nr:DUF547 domain-containing protein [Planctomycetota bacterium]
MKILKRFGPILLGLSLMIVLLLGAARCQSVIIDPGYRLEAYDPQPFQEVLASVVQDGLVDYEKLRNEHQDSLNLYLDAVARFGPATTPGRFATPEDRLAYHLNVYNAIMLRRWLDAGAGRSGGDSNAKVHKAWFFFDLWLVDGKRISLDALEQRIIRPTYQEPRIHFALVCGAMSCPSLLDEPFVGERLDDQLESLGNRWLKEPDGLHVDEDGVVWMSSIFQWYLDDFEAMGELAGVIDRFLDDEDSRRSAALDAAQNGRIQFLPYDWSINRYSVKRQKPDLGIGSNAENNQEADT